MKVVNYLFKKSKQKITGCNNILKEKKTTNQNGKNMNGKSEVKGL